jgi:7-carboxy-7-deazaguanine synthase
MQVVEKFVSINGEGRNAGQLAVFIRFKGCNLHCSYCDTMWANTPTVACVETSPQEVVQYVKSTGINRVTLTGGEPTLQPELHTLLELFAKENLSVEIETNGATDVSKFCDITNRASFTLDYKCPSSGMESHMLVSNYDYLSKSQGDVVKFVVGSIQDLDTMVRVVDTYDLLSKCYVYVSAVFGNINPVDIVEYLKSHRLNGVALQLQLHKYVWEPTTKGV